VYVSKWDNDYSAAYELCENMMNFFMELIQKMKRILNLYVTPHK
jgi:hypothetical protein